MKVVTRIWKTYLRNRQLRQERYALYEMPDGFLEDIGLTRGSIDFYTSRCERRVSDDECRR